MPSQSAPQTNGYGSLAGSSSPAKAHPEVASARVHPARAPILSRLLFSYASPLLQLGNERQLSDSDFWALDEENRSSSTFEHFHAEFQHAGGSLPYALWGCFWPAFASFAAGTVFLAAVSLFAPIVLNNVITSFAAPQIDTASLAVWVGCFFASRVLNAVLLTQMGFYMQLVALRVTVAIKSLLFHKTLRRSAREPTGKDKVADLSNLYSSDVMSIFWAVFIANNAWILPIQIGIVVYMLYVQLGMAAFAGLGVIALTMTSGFFVANVSGGAFGDIMMRKDGRMRAVKEVFGAIQIVKLNAWETKFAAKITELREKELEAVTRYMYLQALEVFIMWASPVFVSVVSFAVYTVGMGQMLTAAKVFTSIALFNAIREPLQELPGVISFVTQAKVSIDRITKYLEQDEFDPTNVTREDPSQPDDVTIAIENGSFGWNKDAQTPLLRNVNLQVQKGDLAVVHGVVGSGKSSLCSALLGEMEKLSGKVFVRGSVAYYSQQTWVQNMTIRDNILFGSAFDERRYHDVLDACGLVPDLAGFPAGDATEIGQKGVNLSGGQKARLCLARACYSDADVFILDSPLAAVDAAVQSEIFGKCFCGLLSSKTIVLVTHSPDIIASKVANVKILVADGELTSVRGEIFAQPRSAFAPKLSPREVKKARNHETVECRAALAIAGRLIDEEKRESGRVSKDVFLQYLDALGGVPAALTLVLVLATWQGFQISGDLWLSHWTSQESTKTNEVETERNMAVYALLGAGNALMVFARAVAVAVFGIRAARYLFEAMTNSLLRAPLRFFDANPIGRIVNRYGGDTSMVDFRLSPTWGSFLSELVLTIFQLATAMYMVSFLGLLIVPLVAMYFKITNFYLTPSREMSRLRTMASSPVLSHLTQSEEGIAVIRAFGPQYTARVVKENFKHVDLKSIVWVAETAVNQWFQVRMHLIGSAIVIVIVSGLVYLRAFLSPGLVGLAFTYALGVDEQIANIVRTWSRLELSMVSPERLIEYTRIPAEGIEKVLVIEPPVQWPRSGSVVFQDVVFSYRPGAPAVLKGLSFEIGSSEKVGIVGRTGAGKSSLTMALFRINELESGRIAIDGVDISRVSVRALRSRLSIIPQSPVLFKGSLRAYMDPFDEFSDASIWLALAKVEMKEQIGALESQLEFELSENGENFSVGERQMLCMARALLSQTRIVVLDEATASIDHATEKKLQDMIAREFGDATVLTIAHRLETVLDSDRIMVLSNGRVVEFDAPKALARNAQSAFHQLAKEGGCLDQLL